MKNGEGPKMTELIQRLTRSYFEGDKEKKLHRIEFIIGSNSRE